MTEYPEHDKLAAVKDQSQAIGSFLDHGPWTLCLWQEDGNNGKPMYVWSEDSATGKRKSESGESASRWDYANGHANRNPEYEEWEEGFFPVYRPIEKLLAEYFGIDLERLEAEKRAMLEEQRRLNDMVAIARAAES